MRILRGLCRTMILFGRAWVITNGMASLAMAMMRVFVLLWIFCRAAVCVLVWNTTKTAAISAATYRIRVSLVFRRHPPACAEPAGAFF